MRHRKLKISSVVLLISVLGIIVFLAGIAVNLIETGQGETYYASLPFVGSNRNETVLSLTVTPITKEEPEPDEQPVDEDIELLEEFIPALDFDALRAEMPGLAAWIRIEDTGVDYPVMQGEDNDYYLTHLPNGKKNERGSIFFDCNLPVDFSAQNTLIYGHNMKSGSMFGSLKKYAQKLYYEEHSTVLIYTPTKDYEVLLFAGYITNPFEEELPVWFGNSTEFNRYVSEIKERSVFQSDVTMEYGDRLVSLCTCSYNVRDGRLILVGKLLER